MGIISTKPNFQAGTYIVASIMNSEFSDVIDDLNDLDVRDGLSVKKALFNANTILKANVDNTPTALAIDEQKVLGRIAGGSITGLTAAQIRTLINVENGATADQTKADIDALGINAATLEASTKAQVRDHTPKSHDHYLEALKPLSALFGVSQAVLLIATATELRIKNAADSAYQSLRASKLYAEDYLYVDEIRDNGAGNITFADLAIFNAHLKAGSIYEKDAGVGVTVDYCLIKDGKAADSDKVDGKHASELQFAQNEEISLGSIPLAIYTPQSQLGTSYLTLKMIDNATRYYFYIDDKPAAPSGWTLKGRLYAVLKSSSNTDYAYAVLRNFTDNTTITSAATNETHYVTSKSVLFDIPASTKNLGARIVWGAAGGTVYCAGVWVEFIAVKD